MAFRSRGLPSRGCNRCRSKKIRCDEGKPSCQKCIKDAYPECKYRDEFERTWRVHTEETIQAVKPTRKSPSPDSGSGPVFSRFFFDWVSGTSPTPGVSITWFDSLPVLYRQAAPESLLNKSIRALAHVNFGKRCGSVESVKTGAELYGDALRMMRETLVSKTDVSMRDMLVSVMLLGIHEAYVDPSMSPSGSWLSHIGGAATLLKKQDEADRDKHSPLDLQVRSMIFRQMLHGSLVSGRRPPMSWEQDITLQNPQLKYVHAHSGLLHAAAVLCSDWRAAFGNLDTTTGLEKLAGFASQAIALDGKLDHWAQTLPAPFGYTIEPINAEDAWPGWLHELLVHPGAPRCSHKMASPVSMMLWRFYWEARLILCQALLYTNFILSGKDFDGNPVRGREGQVESCLLNVIERQCESAITPLTEAYRRAGDDNFKPEGIPSIRGYLMLQILPTVHLCLDQIDVHSQAASIDDRRAWINAMKDFVQLQLGFAKGAAEIDHSRLERLPVQLWSLTNNSPNLSGR